jgi:hypothetical protein
MHVWTAITNRRRGCGPRRRLGATEIAADG